MWLSRVGIPISVQPTCASILTMVPEPFSCLTAARLAVLQPSCYLMVSQSLHAHLSSRSKLPPGANPAIALTLCCSDPVALSSGSRWPREGGASVLKEVIGTCMVFCLMLLSKLCTLGHHGVVATLPVLQKD